MVIFAPAVAGDWRRRSYESTLRHMLMAIEVKASERANSRLTANEIKRDINKLVAHAAETRHRGRTIVPVMLVVDVAPIAGERMLSAAMTSCRQYAESREVGWLYVSPVSEQLSLPG